MPPPSTPFALGTFRSGEHVFAGLVRDDGAVIDIARAAGAPAVAGPVSVASLLAEWPTVLSRLADVADHGDATHRIDRLRVLPPV
ncbi:MAG TPA: hypothetical protein VF657_02595, partial [Actinoplanes sp.]